MQSHEPQHINNRLTKLDCNCAKIAADALGYMVAQITAAEIDEEFGDNSDNPALENILSKEELEGALQLRSNLELVASYIGIRGSTRGIADLLETVRGKEELILTALDVLKELCETPSLYTHFQSFLQPNPQAVEEAIDIITTPISHQKK